MLKLTPTSKSVPDLLVPGLTLLVSVSSTAVREAFQVGEAVDSAVSNAFNKLTEVIEKAENFNLQGKNPDQIPFFPSSL